MQFLRDLQLGTFIALATYNRHFHPDPDSTDPIVDGWIRGSHSTAGRLLKHARNQYSTSFTLTKSRRPWIGTTRPAGEGWLWHATFHYPHRISAGALWADSYMQSVKPLILHCLTDSHSTTLTFADVDNHDEIANAIGQAFDAVLTAGRQSRARRGGDRALDFRVMESTGWNIVSDDTVPIDNFGVGNGVAFCPPLP